MSFCIVIWLTCKFWFKKWQFNWGIGTSWIRLAGNTGCCMGGAGHTTGGIRGGGCSADGPLCAIVIYAESHITGMYCLCLTLAKFLSD